MSERIVIAGAGIGGLALAQALRGCGPEIVVYEKGPGAQSRNQGFRLHIDDNGNAALRTCLPPDVLDLVRGTSGVNGDLVAAYTHRLVPVMTQTFPGTDDEETITNVDRNTFRSGLLHGLDDVVRFGRPLAGYTITDSGRVRVELADGAADECDLLVGADGVGSVVRQELLPEAVVDDLGLRCLYGRMPITEATSSLIPEDFRRGFCWVADQHGCGAAFGPQQFRTRPDGAPADYLMTTVAVTTARLGVPDHDLFALAPEQLWRMCTDLTADWHPTVRALLSHADAATFTPITIRAARRVEAWPTGPVTLLGDAIHTMPPTGGVGANTALQDAATLAGELRAHARGATKLIDAVARYEKVMLPRGFATIDRSLAMADQMFGQAR